MAYTLICVHVSLGMDVSAAAVPASEVDAKDKMSATLHTVGRISGKMSSRVYHATIAHVHGLKKQSEESITSLGSVLELVSHMDTRA